MALPITTTLRACSSSYCEMKRPVATANRGSAAGTPARAAETIAPRAHRRRAASRARRAEIDALGECGRDIQPGTVSRRYWASEISRYLRRRIFCGRRPMPCPEGFASGKTIASRTI